MSEPIKITEDGVQLVAPTLDANLTETSGGAPSSETPDTTPLSYADIEAELRAFEQVERERLGLIEEEVEHWIDENPQEWAYSTRGSTTLLHGGLTWAQDQLIQAALRGLDYRAETLEVPGDKALQLGKEFGNRGQCNPTYFTVGNLVMHLMRLRDEEGIPTEDIINNYVFLTAGACGPCRFGTYATEYRKALRDAGFDGFRVLLFQQQGGLKQATGEKSALELNPKFFIALLKAIVAGDVLNALAYRIRPYEVVEGATNEAMEECKRVLMDAFANRKSVMLAVLKCRRIMSGVEVDRLQPKPKVMIIGEFWAMTTEGAGNYKLQNFLEREGAEVTIQLVTAWVLYNIWEHQYDTKRRMNLRGADKGVVGLEGVEPYHKLALLKIAEKALTGIFQLFANAMGLHGYHLPNMDELANISHEYYRNELRGGEGHMEVGKLIQSVSKKKSHMVVSVKPFGCMPSSGVSDGVQSIVTRDYPDAIFCPIETSGDGEVNVHSRVQMFLFKARKRARAEFNEMLEKKGLTLEEARAKLKRKHKKALFYPKHREVGTGANVVLEL